MRNLTLLTDLYQLTMLNGYYEKNIHEDIVVFDRSFLHSIYITSKLEIF